MYINQSTQATQHNIIYSLHLLQHVSAVFYSNHQA